ncbi:MAG: macrolide export ATP-binding/permease MacB [Candidatus Wallbacteria bacterium HGW-Wallbacteria-1]|jgi:putative ABC transport system permease protein|uniref:Macrolide export ATP-binding/permease MacB n=1 Tax=Candidatus Wallbacteria bacterium HGW-Wallbacteria-1 TaxID=2013854 RepID=A0A2N1PM52_9BACT|nr:MAG: macrolide export ATP-binding/permease MacB [Candidatus Wallbacteria bacterium HGW-Wallbacteria-1]
MFLYLREAIQSLLSSLQRTFLALLGIIIGIASVIAMISVGAIVKAEALRQFQELGTDFIVVSNLADDSATDKGHIPLKSVPFLLSACPSLEGMAPYSMSFTDLAFHGKNVPVSVMGITGAFFHINKLVTDQGRPLADVEQGMYNCVVGSRLATRLKRPGEPDLYGQSLLIHNHMFTIVGVLKEASDNALRPPEINDGVLVPYVTAQRILGIDKITGFIARISDTNNINAVVDQISRIIGQIIKDRQPLIQTADELIAQMNRQMNLLTMLLGVVGSIALVVGGVGVMNVMLVSVAERRREIGIRRAIGARQRDIQGQFLVEALLLCLVGGIIGIAIGVGGSYIIAKVQGWHFFVSNDAITVGVGVSALVGLFFGFYPAWQASKLRPIEALRAN